MLLTDSVQYLKGIGEKRAELFHKLGIFTIEDLLYHLPRGFEDRSVIHNIAELIDGEAVCVKGCLASGVRTFRARNGTRVSQVRLADGSGVMQLTWFNASYITKSLSDPTCEYIFFGKVTYRGMNAEMINPIIEKVSDEGVSKMGKIVPIYPATASLSQRSIRDAVVQALEKLSEPMRETLPIELREKNNLVEINQAIRDVHMPKDFDTFKEARRRLVFEEFLSLQLGVTTAKTMKKREMATPIRNVKCIKDFAASLSFDLTNAQKRVINEIAADMRMSEPMNRLVQGDVGSGKTVVAAAVMYAAAINGFQSVLMAPTEILAEQHYKSMTKFFEPFNIKTAYLSGSQKKDEKIENLRLIESGEAKIIVGTHALITESVRFKNLNLTITDEQHRFGVEQRTRLASKGEGESTHTLVMTATPIPRTLSLVIYGDLDISVIDELPPGRQPIKTVALSEGERAKLYEFILRETDKGRQAYFVCALVEESEAVIAKSATEYAERLKKGAFKNKNVGLLHGRMKPAEKEDVMRRFAGGEIDILVATTVVEVGVDVPNATIMVIENTERFGLSQLHQLRGRVGRGGEKSYCFLLGNTGSGVAKERIKVMCDTNDGFRISEKDLELRGPGEFFGTRQHGLPEMKIGNFFTDMEVLKETQIVAAEIINDDPLLNKAEHRALKLSVEKAFNKVGSILN